MRKPFYLRQRDNGIWYVKFRGEEKWKSCKTTDQATAERHALLHSPGVTADIRFSDFAREFYEPGKSRWLESQAQRGIEYGLPSLKKKQQNLHNYLLPRFGKIPLAALRRRDIESWLLSLKSFSDRKALRADTKNKILTCLREILDDAVMQEYIEVNPAAGIRGFREKQRQEKEIFSAQELRDIFPEDIDALLDVHISLKWATFHFLVVSAGLRPGEVAALQWGNWIRSRKGLIISHSIEKLTRRRKETKTGIIKPVFLVDRAEALLLMLEAQSDKTAPDDLIFTVNEQAIIPETSGKHFKESLKRAGIDRRGRTQYTLRHTFDTLSMKSLDPKIVQQLMGHGSLKMTMGTYYHPTDEDRLEALPKDAREILNSIWSNS